MRRLLIPAVLALFMLPALACGSSTGAGSKPTPAPLAQGQTATVKNWDITLVGVERPGKELVWSQYGNKSAAAGEWVVAIVKLKNTGDRNFGVNNPDFELQAGGATYQVSSDAGAYAYSAHKGGQQVGGQVPPGVEVTYHLVFDLAPNAATPTLVFKQDSKPRFVLP